MKNSKIFTISAVILVVTLICIGLIAGPTVIRDNRITDLATTPMLGRGYSVATNTFQSNCMEKVILTEPSYDMHYEFFSGERSVDATSSSTRTTEETTNTDYKRTKKRGGYADEYSQRFNRMKTQTTTVINSVKYFNHDMFAAINLYTYYASLNEANSKMSKSAISLLKTKDLPGFFSSCGPYYIRSIGRKSTFISNFSYSTVERTRDVSFEEQLKTRLQTFDSVSEKIKGGCNSPDTYKTDETKTETETFARNEYKFAITCKSKRLRIVTHAYGMGKKKGATLISYDLDSFREAIGDAFQAMQKARTGRVATIEVVPWVENTDFQMYVGLEKTDDVYELVKDAQGNPIIDASGNEQKKLVKRGQLLYEKKMVLNENAEFLMEIERADRNLFNLYYKARLCRKDIDINYKKDGKLLKDYQNATVVNNRTGEKQLLSWLDTQLTTEYIDTLLKTERLFMYGTEKIKDSGNTPAEGQADKGGRACIRQIMDGGIYKKSYREYKACADIEKNMAEASPRMVDEFCMPSVKW